MFLSLREERNQRRVGVWLRKELCSSCSPNPKPHFTGAGARVAFSSFRRQTALLQPSYTGVTPYCTLQISLLPTCTPLPHGAEALMFLGRKGYPYPTAAAAERIRRREQIESRNAPNNRTVQSLNAAKEVHRNHWFLCQFLVLLFGTKVQVLRARRRAKHPSAQQKTQWGVVSPL